MRILVTGAAGFAGRYTVAELVRNGHTVAGFDLAPHSPAIPGLDAAWTGDLRDAAAVRRAVFSVRPDACLHLGAVSFVPSGSSDPDRTLSVNVRGTLNVLDAIAAEVPSARLLVVSSAQLYGPATSAAPVREDAPASPTNLYALSKAAADLAALAAARHRGLQALTARPTNHTGPGQSSSFAIPCFVNQILAIARGERPPVLEVGNLESQRDIADVRDVAHAYRLLIERGRPGQAYNIATGRRVRMADVIDQLCAMTGIQPERKTDPLKFRPTDQAPILDTARIRDDTGWTAAIPLDQTLRDMLASP